MFQSTCFVRHNGPLPVSKIRSKPYATQCTINYGKKHPYVKYARLSAIEIAWKTCIITFVISQKVKQKLRTINSTVSSSRDSAQIYFGFFFHNDNLNLKLINRNSVRGEVGLHHCDFRFCNVIISRLKKKN